MNERFIFSTQEIADIVGVSHSVISRMPVEPISRAGGRTSYYLPAVMEHLRESGAINAGGRRINLDIERAKLAKEQAAKTKIERQLKKFDLEERKRSLVSVKDIEAYLDVVFVSMRQKLLSLPARILQGLADIEQDNYNEQIELVKGVLLECLSDISTLTLD